MSARRKGGELTPAELERLNTAWRHATATDRLSRSALVSVLSEIGLDLSDRDIDGAFAGKDALAHDDLLLLYVRTCIAATVHQMLTAPRRSGTVGHRTSSGRSRP
jgi:hypothetical protein